MHLQFSRANISPQFSGTWCHYSSRNLYLESKGSFLNQVCCWGSSLFHKSYFPDIPPPASMLQGVSCDMLLCLLPQVLGPAECLFLCSCMAYLFTHLGWHQESPNLTNSLYLMQLWLAKLPTGLLVASIQVSDSRPVPDCFEFIAQC